MWIRNIVLPSLVKAYSSSMFFYYKGDNSKKFFIICQSNCSWFCYINWMHLIVHLSTILKIFKKIIIQINLNSLIDLSLFFFYIIYPWINIRNVFSRAGVRERYPICHIPPTQILLSCREHQLCWTRLWWLNTRFLPTFFVQTQM